ncbi:MAG: hypothetical protein ACHQM6_00805 [Candidatus Kapaibacterium sp.]
MTLRKIIQHLLFFIGLFALAVLIYRNGLHIPYYADDYQRVFTNPGEAISQAFSKATISDGSYRPLETIALGIIQKNWGWDTFPFRILSLLFHAAGAFLVFHALRFRKIDFWAAILGAIFVVISQMSAAAVLGNDTQSQITGAFFSALSLWLLYRYNLDSDNHWRYVCSVSFFFLALISKETSTGLCLSVAFMIYVMQPGKRSFRIKQTVLRLLPYALGFVTYWVLRTNGGAASPSFGNANLSLKFGANIPINIGLFVFQSILPFSSMAIVKAMYYKDHLRLALMLLFTALFAFSIGYGLWRSPHRKIIKALCVIIFCGWFPAMILNHISELYAYSSVFPIGVLFGIGVEWYLQDKIIGRSRVAFFCVMFTLFFAAMANERGVDEKAVSMKRQGDRAAIFLPQIVALAKTMPQNKWMYLVSPPDSSFEYSMFAIHGFRASMTADSLVRFLSNRPDIEIYPADSARSVAQSKIHPGIIFTFDPATLHVYPVTPIP